MMGPARWSVLIKSRPRCRVLIIAEWRLQPLTWSNRYPSWWMRLHLPPEKSFFSYTSTSKPACASLAAVDVPPTPAPTTMALSRFFPLSVIERGGFGGNRHA